MNQKSLKKGCGIAALIYLTLALLFYLVGGEQLRFRDERTDMLSPKEVAGELLPGMALTQKIAPEEGLLTGVTLLGATYARQNTGPLLVEVWAGETRLAAQTVDIGSMGDNAPFFVAFSPAAQISGEAELRVSAPESAPGNAVTFYLGDSYPAARAQVDARLSEGDYARLNGATLGGGLCLSLHTRKNLWFGQYYWVLAGAGLLALIGLCVHFLVRNRAGKASVFLNLFSAFSRYRYLMQQLVARDFKTKYKRSVLGVLWSLLNPLLTMLVQYVVFSTLFRSDIPNFPVYLLSGIVCFSFFSEATTMALSSIVGNAALITKVYVPKYIYPLTRVMSSIVNFALSLIPLFVVLLITRTPVRPAILLLPFGLLCLFAVSLGIGLLLATAMVFFRDIQFLWGVLSMLWMYATPVFYPESILPTQLLPLFKLNPLYHILRFVRIILLDGVSPEPKAYLLCFLASFIPLLLGAWVFKKKQDQFVLNI